MILFIVYCSYLQAIEITGSGESKQLALEDAYMKINLRFGAIVGSYELMDEIKLNGGISLADPPLIKNITIKNCQKIKQIFDCKFDIKIISKNQDLLPYISHIQTGPCNEIKVGNKREIVECFELVQISKGNMLLGTLIKGRIHIYIKEVGPKYEEIRHYTKYQIRGIGRTDLNASISFISQAQNIYRNHKLNKRRQESILINLNSKETIRKQ